MRILQYFKSLLRNIKKNTLIEDARVTSASLKNTVIPAYEDADKHFRNKDFTSDEVRALEKRFTTSDGIKRNEGLINGTLDRLTKVHDIVDLCLRVVGDKFEENTVIQGITVLKLNVIRLMESSGFLARYSMHLLNYIYIHETAAITKDEFYIKDNLSKGAIAFVEDNFAQFCELISILGVDEKKIDKALNEIPDIAFGTDPEATVTTLGEHVVNPIGVMNFSPTSSNPIYHIALMIAEYQANRYKENVDLKRVLELRLLNLQKASKANPDAKLEKEIEYTQSRVDKLSDVIRRAEERYVESAHVF